MSGLLATLGIGFNINKAKPALQMCISRLAININRKTNQVKIKRREVGVLLSEDKEEKARIRVEAIIREDFTIEAYEILSLLCELLVERMRLVATQDACPPDLKEAVCTLIWAADRAEVAELDVIRKQFTKKYGSSFARDATDNVGSVVNDRVVSKLAVTPPSGLLVEAYLKEIAKEYGVNWEPAANELTLEQMAMEASPAPTGYSVAANAREREIAALRAADAAEAAADRDDYKGDLSDLPGTGFGPRSPPPPSGGGMPPKSLAPQGHSSVPPAPSVPTVYADAKPAARPGTEPHMDTDLPPPYAPPSEGKSDAGGGGNDDDDGATGAAGGGGSGTLDFDSLTARFAALKR